VTQPVDRNILLEIVRVVSTRAKVPDRARVRGNEYQLTYLDDHKHRLEDALRRHDSDRLNMLYGQLASKVKYQLLRNTAVRRAGVTAGKRGPQKRGAGRAAAARTRSPAAAKRKDAKRKSPTVKKRRAAVPKKTRVAKKRVASRAARR
jgi:hypothetical protein